MSYNLQLKKHCYILTGGPGSGKSTLLEALAQLGFSTVPEVARQIIQAELAVGGNAIHTGDQLAFRDKMMAQSIADYLQVADTSQPILFDRGIPDLIGYSYLIQQPIPEAYWKAVNNLRYNPTVLIAPPWEAIYQHDAERKQDFQEAQATYQAVMQGYQDSGYHLLELPKSSVRDRVQFVIEAIHCN